VSQLTRVFDELSLTQHTTQPQVLYIGRIEVVVPASTCAIAMYPPPRTRSRRRRSCAGVASGSCRAETTTRRPPPAVAAGILLLFSDLHASTKEYATQHKELEYEYIYDDDATRTCTLEYVLICRTEQNRTEQELTPIWMRPASRPSVHAWTVYPYA
jgi:hypothetical protein